MPPCKFCKKKVCRQYDGCKAAAAAAADAAADAAGSEADEDEVAAATTDAERPERPRTLLSGDFRLTTPTFSRGDDAEERRSAEDEKSDDTPSSTPIETLMESAPVAMPASAATATPEHLQFATPASSRPEFL